MEGSNVSFRQVPPEPLPVDFEGTHFVLYGNLAFFYRWFKYQHSDEWVQEQLHDYLVDAKRRWREQMKKNGAATPDNAVLTELRRTPTF